MKHITTTSPIIFYILLAVFIFSPAPQITFAANSADALEWEITADKLTRYENPPSVIAEGNVLLQKKEKVADKDKEKEEKNQWADLLGEDVITGDTKSQEDQEEETQEAEEPDGKEKIRVLTTIKADWMVYDADLGRIKARGNLVIDIGPDKLTADSGIVELESETGTFENATIIRQYKDLHFEGEVIEKTGSLTYRIKDGWVITCKLKDEQTPPWSFAAKDADITENGYAKLKHATFRIKGIPVFYTPYMILPAKNKRQSGLLIPAFSLSDRDGFGLELPFFVNLSPSSDLTFYPQYITERGFMFGAEFRYVAGTGDKGFIMGNYLSDELSDPSQVDYYEDTGFTHDNKKRYWLRGMIDQDFGEWTTRLDADIVSDEDYLTEFNAGLTGFAKTQDRFQEVFGRGFKDSNITYRENTFQFLRSFNNGSSFQGELLVIDDLDDPQSSPSQLWKLPSLTYTGVVPLYSTDTGIDFSWDADYVNYWREEGVGAHRIDLYPKVSMSIPLSKYLETTVTAGIRDTFYGIQVNEDDNDDEISENDDGEGASDDDGANDDDTYDYEDGNTENRLLYSLEGEISTTMIGDFAVNFGNVTTFSHTFRPYIKYKFVSEDDNDNIPYMDSVDSISDQNKITYGLKNYFDIAGEKDNGKSFNRDYGYFKISQSYDFRSEESDTPLTPVEIEIRYYPWERFSLKYKTEIDVYDDGMSAHTVEADLTTSRGDYLSADYKFDEQEETNSITVDAWLILPYYFAVGYGIEKSIEDGVTVEENLRLRYKPACWSVEFLSEYTEDDQTYMIVFRLANIGSPLGLNVMGGDSQE
ncbi:MAG: hypothetical protein CSA31_01535 [Desulfobulbus propionicus]|nr:MAG: hypothetical protein CSA31_01535 [Desulfobulbus propionicus]